MKCGRSDKQSNSWLKAEIIMLRQIIGVSGMEIISYIEIRKTA